MVRDPVKRHWSHAKRYFSKEKAKERGYRSFDSRQRLFEFFKRTRRFSEFSKIIGSWTKVYPPERLLVINQEDAFADPVRIFERALRHIGLAPDARMQMKKVARNTKNRGPVVPMPDDVKAYLEEDVRRRAAEFCRGVEEAFRARGAASRPRLLTSVTGLSQRNSETRSASSGVSRISGAPSARNSVMAVL